MTRSSLEARWPVKNDVAGSGHFRVQHVKPATAPFPNSYLIPICQSTISSMMILNRIIVNEKLNREYQSWRAKRES